MSIQLKHQNVQVEIPENVLSMYVKKVKGFRSIVYYRFIVRARLILTDEENYSVHYYKRKSMMDFENISARISC
jgi:hypothetical protein